ncbi:MAG: glycosyltransferase family 2 protein [Cyclobacteriaceae bacterium]|jgi:hypothetical protein|nr:glycosyltransferase family 2 protein [Cyclobacteriaceae bacterium]
MQLSVILVNYRGWKKLKPCLESLRCLHQSKLLWEVLIVDNQSNDGQLETFILDFPEFRFIENSGNFGFAHGCNTGARNTSGEYLMFLNPDTIVNLPALEQVLHFAHDHPEFRMVTCQQLTSTGKDTRPYGFFLGPATLTSGLRALYRINHLPYQQKIMSSGEHILLPEWISGSFMCINRNNLEALGGWCEDYWMYYEDADLCKRVRDDGGEIGLLTHVSIFHNHGGASRVNPQIKAITKSEVMFSKHVYVSRHFSGLTKTWAHSFLIINNLLLGPLIMGLIGVLLWFNASARSYLYIYRNLWRYYFNVIMKKKWISPKAASYAHPSN